jgi:hypothetical protein
MIEFLVFEGDPLVRSDIIDIIGAFSPCLPISVAETMDILATKLSRSSNPSVAVLSGSGDQLSSFFAQYPPSPQHAYVVIGDEDVLKPIENYVINTVPRPFSEQSLSEGIKNALSFLHLDR